MSFTKVRLQPDFFPFLPTVVVGMAGAIGLWWLTSALGASVASGAEAVFCTFLVLVVLWAVQSLVGWPASTVGCAAPALSWPCWWPVLTSLALRQVDPTTGVVPMRFAHAWYSSAWFRALVEVGLLVFIAWVVMRKRRKHRELVLSGTPPALAMESVQSVEGLRASTDAMDEWVRT